MTPTEFCETHHPCESGRQFAVQFATMEEVWDNCDNIDWLFWSLEKIDHPYDSRKLGAKFVREIWHLLKDERSKEAIIAIEEDRLTDEIKAASSAATSASATASAAASASAAAASAFASAAASAFASAYATAYAVEATAYAAAAYVSARKEMKEKRVKILKTFVGNPFK